MVSHKASGLVAIRTRERSSLDTWIRSTTPPPVAFCCIRNCPHRRVCGPSQEVTTGFRPEVKGLAPFRFTDEAVRRRVRIRCPPDEHVKAVGGFVCSAAVGDGAAPYPTGVSRVRSMGGDPWTAPRSRFPPFTRISLRIKRSNVLCATFFALHSVRAPDDFSGPPVISAHTPPVPPVTSGRRKAKRRHPRTGCRRFSVLRGRRRAGAPGEGRARLPGRSRRGGPLGGLGRWAGLFVQPCP
ncbi:hypothetical protein GCM10010284_22370 [Streptomyces rubiginosohelvolus]|uniref:Transposase n=1 Tax=Streptomyces rubiginosohelvolus TaxID=67362 RepID=A0ABQ3BJ19_9ACTN|nr:hypothetical protein GCM10010284_22370 [Streptomyces rubiginosohelvolus]GGZ41771.1 hypothetical protein GCM10010328_14450 [Streptomyces pluricolorescens]